MTTITVGRPAMPTTCVSTAAPSAPVLSCGAVAAPRTCTPTGTSDGWIAHDFGCVLNVARPENGAALTQYRKMRMAVPGFKLREFDPAKANSDRAVIAQWRQWLAANRPTRAPMPDPAQVDQWCTCNRCLFQRRDTAPMRAPIGPPFRRSRPCRPGDARTGLADATSATSGPRLALAPRGAGRS
jgi:hypothetical protein